MLVALLECRRAQQRRMSGGEGSGRAGNEEGKRIVARGGERREEWVL